jgi:hypothetical protein
MAETKSKNQRDIIVKSLRGKFNDEMSKTEHKDLFAVAIIAFDVNIHSIREESYKNEKVAIDPNTKNFRPIKFEPIKDDLLPNLVLSHNFDEKKNRLNFSSQSGMFKIIFSDGSVLFFAQRLVGMGKSTGVESYAVAHQKTFNKYYQYLKKQLKLNSKPKVGLYRIIIHNTTFGPKLHYEPIKQKDFKKNILVVSKDQKDLNRKELLAKGINWITPQKLPLSVEVKIRYKSVSARAKIIANGKDKVKIIFSKPQRAITPGQSAVFYKGEELLGGGVIL